MQKPKIYSELLKLYHNSHPNARLKKNTITVLKPSNVTLYAAVTRLVNSRPD